ncbi:MAG: hypothetical protein IPG58_10170 [Acidobacteria bacterium]|nr:hypothetical protein [Acidobacteriota bacterium]
MQTAKRPERCAVRNGAHRFSSAAATAAFTVVHHSSSTFKTPEPASKTHSSAAFSPSATPTTAAL